MVSLRQSRRHVRRRRHDQTWRWAVRVAGQRTGFDGGSVGWHLLVETERHVFIAKRTVTCLGRGVRALRPLDRCLERALVLVEQSRKLQPTGRYVEVLSHDRGKRRSRDGPIRRYRLKRTRHGFENGFRQFRPDGCQRFDAWVAHCTKELELVGLVAGKRNATSREAPGEKRRRVNIGSLVHGFATGLLRRHAAGRPLDDADSRCRRRTQNLRDAEIGDFHASAPVEKNVRRRDVAVDDGRRLTAFVVEAVGVRERYENALDDVPSGAIGQPQAPRLIQPKNSRQSDPRYILEDEGSEAWLLPKRPHLDDTRVLQPSADRGLTSQRVGVAVRLALTAGDRLYCDEAPSGTAGKKHLASPADPEALQNVESLQRSGKLLARKHAPSTVGGNAGGAKALELPIAFVLQIQGVPPRPLSALPAIRIVVVRDRTATARATGGFLDIQRVDLVASYPDGSQSESFAYDIATRKALDAVVIAAFCMADGIRHVFLRSAVRPPCALRSIAPAHDGALWELPAGLVEPGENPAEAAARELGEELGFAAAPGTMHPLGEWTFPAPGVIGERHVFFAVEVDPRKRAVPTEDGSPLERAAAIVSLPVEDAIEHCRRGEIRDAKTELGLRRLAEIGP